MKYAWIKDGKVRDICQGENPTELYFAEIAAHYDTQVPDEAKNGDNYVDGKWTSVPIPVTQESPNPPKTWGTEKIRNGLTLTDKVSWDNNTTPQIITAKVEFQAPKEVAYTTELLEMLVVSKSISQASMDKILAEPFVTPVVAVP